MKLRKNKGCVNLIIGIIIAVIFFLFLIAAFMPIRIILSFKDKKADIIISYGLVKYNIPLSKKKKKTDVKTKEKAKDAENDSVSGFTKFFAILQAFYDTSKDIRRSITVERLKAEASYCSGDVAFTGMAVGLAYAEIYKLIGFLANIFTISSPEITIKPVYEDSSFLKIEAESIIKTKAAHIIFTGIKFYSRYKKALKERID